MTIDDASTEAQDRLSVAACFLVRDQEAWKPTTMVDIESTVAFAAQVDFRSPGSYQIALELWRGDQVRDRRAQQIGIDARLRWRSFDRLHWSDRADASSRLKCRLQIDGTDVGEWQLLLLDAFADAQGRMRIGPSRDESPDTRAAFEKQLDVLYARP